MTATRVVTYCDHCGDLETMHEIRADGTRGKRLGSACRADGTPCCGVACTGYVPGRVEERPPEEELRRRLAAVLELHEPAPREDASPACSQCLAAWPCPTVRAARGET